MAGGVYIRRCQLYMTPKTNETMSRAFRSQVRQHYGTWWWRDCPQQKRINTKYRMTLCGSEVPQDRWRGRTAGSGMWTLTRDNLLSWSLDDPAIPYG